jgi:phosphoadenosine phosphosulfate reductase
MDMEKEAMEILMLFGKGGVVADSGGKDSSVLKRIAEKCHEKYGVDFAIEHNHTTIDAPETVYFIRQERERFLRGGWQYNISYPGTTFEKVCYDHGMLPTRIVRFCCAELKERQGRDRSIRTITGVRRDESTMRMHNQGIITMLGAKEIVPGSIDGDSIKRTKKGGVIVMNYDNSEKAEMVYTCFRTNKTLVNPLLNWTEDDIWRYIRDEKIPVNPLYECGYTRVGCVGCPMARYKNRARDFARYPKYKDRYIRIADKIVQKKKESGRKKSSKFNFKDGLEYFRFWIEDPNVEGQFSFDMDGNITEDYT